MSYKVALTSQTGDCGKSAIAFTLALEAYKNKKHSKIIDLDKEHKTCSLWKDDREHLNIRPKINVVSVLSAQEAIDIDESDFLTIYDCPSRASEAIIHISKHVDLVVIPTPPNKKSILLHLWMIAKLINHIPASKISILFTRVKTPSELSKARHLIKSSDIEGRTLSEIGIKILDSHIKEKTGYGIALNNSYWLTDTSYLPLNFDAKEAILEIMSTLIYNNQNND